MLPARSTTKCLRLKQTPTEATVPANFSLYSSRSQRTITPRIPATIKAQPTTPPILPVIATAAQDEPEAVGEEADEVKEAVPDGVVLDGVVLAWMMLRVEIPVSAGALPPAT